MLTTYHFKAAALAVVEQPAMFAHFIDVSQRRHRNPFREDRRAGCYLRWRGNVLYFIDPATGQSWDGIDFLMTGYGIDETEACRRAYESEKVTTPEVKPRRQVFTSPTWNALDVAIWKQWGITTAQLSADGVSAEANNIGSYVISYPSGSYKVYRPYRKYRFFGTAGGEEIGNAADIAGTGIVVITKSYKDHRIIRNCGHRCVYVQGEGMVPKWLRKVQGDKIYVAFDDDEAGHRGSQRVIEYMGGGINICPQGGKDFGEMVEAGIDVKQFLRSKMYE